eukprot:1136842-Pelagomonas_calceolata.AAC.5
MRQDVVRLPVCCASLARALCVVDCVKLQGSARAACCARHFLDWLARKKLTLLGLACQKADSTSALCVVDFLNLGQCKSWVTAAAGGEVDH